MNQTINFTKHADIRVQQRGIDRQVVEYLLIVGRKTHCGGGSVRYNFTPASRRRLKSQLPSVEYAHIESKLNSFAILSNTGDVITVGHQYKRIRH